MTHSWLTSLDYTTQHYSMPHPAKLKKYAGILKAMGVAPPAMCKAMVKAADPGLVRCLCECAVNILKGRVRLSPPQKTKLLRHKKDLRALVKKTGSSSSKKRILQKGGFLPALLDPIKFILKLIK